VADDSSKGVLRGNPHVEVLAPGTRGLTETLASGMFDVAMCYDSGAYWRALVACAEAGIPARASYTHKGFSSLATIPLRFRGRDSYPALIREAAGQFTGLAADWSLRPSVFASDSDEREAASFAARVGAADGVPVVACFPMTRQRTGSWGPDRFADVLNRVHASTGCRPVILGGKCDSGGLERVAELVSCPCNVCAGEIGVSALVAWLRGHAAAALTSDSGPRHMANAAGVEVFFIRNPASGRVEVGPYVSTEHDFGGGGEFLRGRALKRALDGVDAAEVAASIVSAIEASRGHGRGDRVPGHG
jgi:ADP-heptose:LPS heptosyltransferase